MLVYLVHSSALQQICCQVSIQSRTPSLRTSPSDVACFNTKTLKLYIFLTSGLRKVSIIVIIICTRLTYVYTVTMLNQSILTINITLQYTMSDGLTVEYSSTPSLFPTPGVFWFGGAKATPNSSPNLTCELLSSAPLVGTYLRYLRSSRFIAPTTESIY